MGTFFYNNEDYKFNISSSNKDLCVSKFDSELQAKWNRKMDDGIFRYKLHIDDEKCFGEKLYLQLNIDRAVLRRQPCSITSINQPFDRQQFNFSRIKDEEKLFMFQNDSAPTNHGEHAVIINVSPLEYGHVLLVPSIDKELPQVLTEEALQVAVEMSLLSGTLYFRMGFNSMGAFATVNHLHLHGYYLQRNMYLETARVEKVLGPCYKLLNFPSKGFVFQIKTEDDIKYVVKNVYQLVNFLQTHDLPHNLYITRGVDFEPASKGDCELFDRNCIRIYVWARKPGFGMKELTSLNPATCELFGHMVIKNKNDFESITETDAVAILNDLTDEPFENVMSHINEIFPDHLR